MKAITVRQPWAAAMFIPHGAKNIENRTFGTTYRGPLAIVASKLVDDSPTAVTAMRLIDGPTRFGHIIGVVDLESIHEQFTADCHCTLETDGGWAKTTPLAAPRTMRHWILTRPRPLTGDWPFTGFLGIHELGTDIAAAITATGVPA